MGSSTNKPQKPQKMWLRMGWWLQFPLGKGWRGSLPENHERVFIFEGLVSKSIKNSCFEGGHSPKTMRRYSCLKDWYPKLSKTRVLKGATPLKQWKGSHMRKFRSQTSDNMDRWKAEQGRGREKRKIRREKSRRERVRRKKMQMREKVGKSRNTVIFQWFMAPGGRKVGSLKRRVRSQLARRAMKTCTPLWREAHFEVKMYKAHHCRTTFGSWDVEKMHAVVARSTFPSQHVQNTPAPDHFWKLRCRKSARGCGAKHISKSKCTKHTIVGQLLEVEMSKNCTRLWREAHFEVKMYKTPHVRATFAGSDVEKVHAVVVRSTFRSQNVKNTRVSDHFWRASLHCNNYTTLHSATLYCTTLHYITQHYNYNYTTTLHCSPLRSTTLHYTPLITLNHTTLHYITLHYTPKHYITLHYTTFHYTSLHYTTLQLQLHYNYNYE